MEEAAVIIEGKFAHIKAWMLWENLSNIDRFDC